MRHERGILSPGMGVPLEEKLPYTRQEKKR
jgi:hypothetical protein